MRNDFEFWFFGGHLQANGGVATIAATIVALALIASLLIALSEFSSWKVLALGLAIFAASARKFPTLSSPAEQAERSEGKGTQVMKPKDPGRTGRAKLSKNEQISAPGSAKYADAMASLARANDDVPAHKPRAARARRG